MCSECNPRAARSGAYRLILDALEVEGVAYVVHRDGSVSAKMPDGWVTIRVSVPR